MHKDEIWLISLKVNVPRVTLMYSFECCKEYISIKFLGKFTTCLIGDMVTPENETAFVGMQQSAAPRKIYILIDFIKFHLCSSVDSGIGRCPPSQRWPYQGSMRCIAFLVHSYVILSEYCSLVIIHCSFDCMAVISLLVALTSQTYLQKPWHRGWRIWQSRSPWGWFQRLRTSSPFRLS